MEKQKAEKERSSEAAQWRSREAKKQRSRKVEKQKQRTIKEKKQGKAKKRGNRILTKNAKREKKVIHPKKILHSHICNIYTYMHIHK